MEEKGSGLIYYLNTIVAAMDRMSSGNYLLTSCCESERSTKSFIESEWEEKQIRMKGAFMHAMLHISTDLL